MIEVQVTLAEPPADDCAGVLVPKPFDTWDQTFLHCRIEGATVSETISARNSGQHVYWIRDFDPAGFRVTYTFDRQPGSPPDWLWSLSRAPFEASAELTSQAAEMAGQSDDTVRRLVDKATEQESILQGRDTVPALCGLTEGSCVDIHTWFIAALHALGGEATYLHGYYFRENEMQSPGFHCWLATRDEDGIQNWDLSHALKYGRIPAQPGLNPHPGERVIIGAGKDLVFDVDGEQIECHLFCHPTIVSPNGRAERARINVERDSC